MNTDPTPSPTRSHLVSPEEATLLIIDVQERLGAAMPGKVLNRVVLNAALLARTAGLLDVPVVASEQYPQGLGPTVAGVLEHLPPGAPRIAKTSFSCTAVPDILAALRSGGRRQVVLLGMEAHICVLQTALGLEAHGMQAFVVEDAVCSRRLEDYENALARLRQAGITVTTAESVAFEWLGDARHPHFKTVAGWLR